MRIQIVVWSACLLAAGCGLTGNRRAMHQVVGQAEYREARLEYALDAGQLGVPVAVSRIGAQQVSYEEVPSAPLSERSVGTLRILYPHPAHREGMALVGVVVQQRRTPQRGMVPSWRRVWQGLSNRDETFVRGIEDQAHEAWVLDIPKQQLDTILATVAENEAQNSTATRSHSGVRLTAAVDGQTWKLPSHSHPELDALMQRVRSTGQLISYRGAAQPAMAQWERPGSLVALEQHQGELSGETALARLPQAQRSLR